MSLILLFSLVMVDFEWVLYAFSFGRGEREGRRGEARREVSCSTGELLLVHLIEWRSVLSSFLIQLERWQGALKRAFGSRSFGEGFVEPSCRSSLLSSLHGAFRSKKWKLERLDSVASSSVPHHHPTTSQTPLRRPRLLLGEGRNPQPSYRARLPRLPLAS